jgi:2-methylcitrate dehydratase PrpD
VTAAKYDLAKVTARLGKDFDLRENAYKPYACGLVVHPAIDGCSQLHRESHPAPESIVAVRARVAPLVLDLCNKRDLKRALESKYSIYHACAIGLVRGKGGLQEFTEEAVADPKLEHVRSVTTAVADPSITEDQVHIEVTLRDGRKLVKFVEQSLGNVHRPLGNDDLSEKFRDQAVLALPKAQVDTVLEQCWRIADLANVGDLARATLPVRVGASPARFVR